MAAKGSILGTWVAGSKKVLLMTSANGGYVLLTSPTGDAGTFKPMSVDNAKDILGSGKSDAAVITNVGNELTAKGWISQAEAELDFLSN